MTESALYLILADAVLVAHFLFVVFVVMGLAMIFVGYFRRWHWVRNLWFRLLHLAAIAVVVAQAWAGVICPLTTWEMALRARAGAETYAGSFIQHWLQSILYYSAPEWVFVLCYTLFGTLVAASWFIVRPGAKIQ
ncbi:MAG: hypothetical protein Hals2KO_18220 [Halioglobus sp.]